MKGGGEPAVPPEGRRAETAATPARGLRIAAIAAGLGLLWFAAMTYRNRRIARPPATDDAGRPYEVHPFVFSDGEAVEAIVTGEGPPALLLPGADGIKETFADQIPAVARRYRVIAPDLRTRFAPSDGFERLVRDGLELLDAFGGSPAVLLGQSLGGAIAMALAARHPERVRALVLCNTLARVSYEHVGINRTGLAPVAMVTTRYLPTRLARLAARLWSRLDVWIFDSSPGAERVIEYALWRGPRPTPPTVSRARVSRLQPLDLRPELPSIAAPTLVLKGPRDHYTPPAWAKEIARLIPGAEYREVAGTGHVGHISMPAAFNLILLEWLAGVEARRRDARREAGK